MQLPSFPEHDNFQITDHKWIGNVPSHWELRANKYIFSLKKQAVGKRSAEYDLLSLTLRGIIKRDMENPEGKFPAEFDTYQEVSPGDFVFCHFDVEETPRTVGLSDFHGMITGAYTVYRTQKSVDPRFLLYFYLNADSNKKLRSLYTGLRNTISKDAFASFKTPMPPLPEQRAIAAFLDDKCAKIDEAVKIKEDQIALLRERRQIIIQDAVTLGLNPTAPMKDSGIEWIGKIPAHWVVKRVKHVAIISPSKSLDGVVRNNDQAVFLPMEAISETGVINQNARMSVKDVFDGFTYFQRNDVVIAKITPCFENGKGAFLGNLETTHGFGTTELHVFRPRKISGEFLYLLLNRLAFRKHAEEFMTGSAGQKRVPTPFMANYQFALPSEFEQGEIIEFCEAQSKAINNLISIKENQIASLKEYKTSLINAAVTGKIKIA